jgi:hypothetical protein
MAVPFDKYDQSREHFRRQRDRIAVPEKKSFGRYKPKITELENLPFLVPHPKITEKIWKKFGNFFKDICSLRALLSTNTQDRPAAGNVFECLILCLGPIKGQRFC